MSPDSRPPAKRTSPPGNARDLVSERLKLAWISEDLLRALIAGPEDFAALTGWPVMEAYVDFPGALEYSLDQWEEGVADPNYWMYLILLPGTPAPDRVIGLIGFKGGPAQSADGSVEIGYSIAPAFQGRGFATEAVSALVKRAAADPAVTSLLACTLAERNASCRVLEKNDFLMVEEISDPEEGSLWKWRLAMK